MGLTAALRNGARRDHGRRWQVADPDGRRLSVRRRSLGAEGGRHQHRHDLGAGATGPMAAGARRPGRRRVVRRRHVPRHRHRLGSGGPVGRRGCGRRCKELPGGGDARENTVLTGTMCVNYGGRAVRCARELATGAKGRDAPTISTRTRSPGRSTCLGEEFHDNGLTVLVRIRSVGCRGGWRRDGTGRAWPRSDGEAIDIYARRDRRHPTLTPTSSSTSRRRSESGIADSAVQVVFSQSDGDSESRLHVDRDLTCWP